MIGVYYSASWCGPCRKFTPQLVKFYNDMKKKGHKIEIIFISADRSAESFLEYYQEMPWLSVTWDNVPTVNQLTSKSYQVQGIPHLVILDADDLSVLTLSGRDEVQRDPYGLEFPWRPRTLSAFIPKFIKRSVKNSVAILFNRLQRILNGLLNMLSPRNVISTIFKFVKKFLSFIIIGN